MTLSRSSSLAIAALLGTLLLSGACGVRTEPAPMTGRWDASLRLDTAEVPFRLEVTEQQGALVAHFFDGDRRIPSAPATRAADTVRFAYPSQGGTLTARLVDGRLEGQYVRGSRTYGFGAERAKAPSAVDAVPGIDGLYIIPTTSKKGEVAWRFIVDQKGADVSAAILRVDGDTGALTGRFDGEKFVLGHFSGARPLLLEVTPNADGSLTLRQNRARTLTALKSTTANLPTPTDSAHHTIIRNGTDPVSFRFPDLQGRVVSSSDGRFEGKVVILSVTGSWCPNCHDEAPFLAELYRAYRDRGLEVVALSFEEEAQLKDPARLRAFVQQYGIEYPVLLAGLPETAPAALPQVDHLDSFPTTLFLGRDGRLRATHAGFPSPASRDFYTKAREEITATVERLLLEDDTTE